MSGRGNQHAAGNKTCIASKKQVELELPPVYDYKDLSKDFLNKVHDSNLLINVRNSRGNVAVMGNVIDANYACMYCPVNQQSSIEAFAHGGKKLTRVAGIGGHFKKQYLHGKCENGKQQVLSIADSSTLWKETIRCPRPPDSSDNLCKSSIVELLASGVEVDAGAVPTKKVLQKANLQDEEKVVLGKAQFNAFLQSNYGVSYNEIKNMMAPKEDYGGDTGEEAAVPIGSGSDGACYDDYADANDDSTEKNPKGSKKREAPPLSSPSVAPNGRHTRIKFPPAQGNYIKWKQPPKMNRDGNRQRPVEPTLKRTKNTEV